MTWKNKYILIVVLLLLSSNTNAQLGFIWDLLTGDFSNAIVDGLDYAGDRYWENVSEDAKQLLKIEIDKSKLSAIDHKYGKTNPNRAFNTIVSSLNGNVNSFYEKYSVKDISKMGNGKIAQHIDNSINLSKAKYANQAILSNETETLLSDKYNDIKQSVYDDIRRDPMLGRLINISPDNYLEYYKRSRGTNLRFQKNWMCYLSDNFDETTDRWPENKQFKYRNGDLLFSQDGVSSPFVKVECGNTTFCLVNTRTNEVRCHDLSMLNHKMMPLCTINYEYNGTNSQFASDRIGRLQLISAYLAKGKNKTKTEVTAKELTPSGKKLLYVIPKKYMGPLCLANVYPMQITKENKTASKSLNKEIKKMNKPYISAEFEYVNTSNYISKIVIKCNGNIYEFNL